MREKLLEASGHLLERSGRNGCGAMHIDGLHKSQITGSERFGVHTGLNVEGTSFPVAIPDEAKAGQAPPITACE